MWFLQTIVSDFYCYGNNTSRKYYKTKFLLVMLMHILAFIQGNWISSIYQIFHKLNSTSCLIFKFPLDLLMIFMELFQVKSFCSIHYSINFRISIVMIWEQEWFLLTVSKSRNSITVLTKKYRYNVIVLFGDNDCLSGFTESTNEFFNTFSCFRKA